MVFMEMFSKNKAGDHPFCFKESPRARLQIWSHHSAPKNQPPNPRVRVPRGHDRFDPGGRWDYSKVSHVVSVVLEDFWLLPYLKPLALRSLQFRNVHHPWHFSKSQLSANKHCLLVSSDPINYQDIQDLWFIPKFLIHLPWPHSGWSSHHYYRESSASRTCLPSWEHWKDTHPEKWSFHV